MAQENKLQVSRGLFLGVAFIISGLMLIFFVVSLFTGRGGIPGTSLLPDRIDTVQPTLLPVVSPAPGVGGQGGTLPESKNYVLGEAYGSLDLPADFKDIHTARDDARFFAYEKRLSDTIFTRVHVSYIDISEPTTLDAVADQFISDFRPSRVTRNSVVVNDKLRLHVAFVSQVQAGVLLSFIPHGRRVYVLNVNQGLTSPDEFTAVLPQLRRLMSELEAGYELPGISAGEIQDGVDLGIDVQS